MAGATTARMIERTARDAAFQQCIHPGCGATFAIDEAHFSCPVCGDLVDVVYDWDRLSVPRTLAEFEAAVGQPPRSAQFLGGLAVSRSPAVRSRVPWS